MSDQAFDLALVVTLARPAEAVLEQVMACMGIFKSRGDFDHCAPFFVLPLFDAFFYQRLSFNRKR
jgi:hypothetical protein